MLPFTSLVPLLIREDARSKAQKTSVGCQEDNNSKRQQHMGLNLQPAFVRIFKPRCRTDPYVVAMGDFKTPGSSDSGNKVESSVIRSAESKTRTRRMLSTCPHIESQLSQEARTPLVRHLVDESIDAHLANLSSWAVFDVFKFDAAIESSRGLCLMAEMATSIAFQHNLFALCNVSPTNFYACMREVSNNYYQRNPYHTALHACDVLHAMHCLISEPLTSSILLPLDKLSLIFAAVCHDVAHPGVNQGFIIKTKHVLHSFSGPDVTSLLEKHHFKVGWSILTAFGLLSDMDPASIAYLKSNLLELILATDIARHGSLVEAFKTRSNGDDFCPQQNPEHRTLLMCILMKCADISNPCRPWNMCNRWSALICEEFFKQGDVERKLGTPISPLCDRESCTVSRIQKSFIPHIVQPLFDLYNSWAKTPLSARLQANLSGNLDQWVTINVDEQAAVKQKQAIAQQHQAMMENSEAAAGPPTAETSVHGESSGESTESECDEGIRAFGVNKRGLIPLSINRRKYSMPAALFGNDEDQSLLITIASGTAAGQSSNAAPESAGHRGRGKLPTPQRRYSLFTSPTQPLSTTQMAEAVAVGLGFSLSESKHSEILREIERRNPSFVSTMETVEQSESCSGESSSPGLGKVDDEKVQSHPLTLECNDQAHFSESKIEESSMTSSMHSFERRASEQLSYPKSKPSSITRSTTAPSPVVPLTVYVSATSTAAGTPTTPRKESFQSQPFHSPSCLADSRWPGGQRRGSDGTNLSSYVIGAEISCACRIPHENNSPSDPVSSTDKAATPPQQNVSSLAATRKTRKSLPPPAVVPTWAFIQAKNACSMSTPVVVADDGSAAALVDVACRMKENWTRRGKRWSDGCLTLPQIQKPPLINS